MMDSDRVVEPGSHVSRTVLRSNVWVKKGSQLQVAYSSGNRFYVSSGGVLSGFHRGARDSTIYAEKGARLPARRYCGLIKIVWVDNAERAYQQRFRELPLLKGRVSGGASDDDWEDDDCFEEDDDFDRGVRAVSVSPDSYRRKD